MNSRLKLHCITLVSGCLALTMMSGCSQFNSSNADASVNSTRQAPQRVYSNRTAPLPKTSQNYIQDSPVESSAL